MKGAIAIALLGLLSACNFHGEVDPDLECSTSCEDDQSSCKDDCEQTCISDDDEEACVSDCDQDCDNTYDDCTLSCGENN